MLELALRHKEELNRLKAEAYACGRLDYFSGGWDSHTFTLDESDWNVINLVSVDGGKVHGFYSADINRVTHAVSGLGIVRFGGRKAFLKDLVGFIELLYRKGFLSVAFNVIEGNVGAKSLYDRFIEIVGDGRVARAVGEYTYGAKINGILRKRYLYEVILTEEVVLKLATCLEERCKRTP